MKRGPKLTLVPGESKQSDSPRQQGPKPGVYENEIHPPGEHWVIILMPSGKVGTLKFPDELWDDDVIPNLWQHFDKKAKTANLWLR